MHFYFVSMKNEKSWIPIGDTYQATDDIFVTVRDETGMHYEFHLLPGFRCDGCSAPWCFHWFAPKWHETNDLYNIAVCLHDALYATGLMHREHADDLLRGLLRDAGFSRFKASTICYCVNQFAASHYDKDELDTGAFVKLRVYYPETR